MKRRVPSSPLQMVCSLDAIQTHHKRSLNADCHIDIKLDSLEKLLPNVNQEIANAYGILSMLKDVRLTSRDFLELQGS